MTATKKTSDSRMHIQFAYYEPTLPSRIAEDIQRSQFNSRPKYINALLEKVLALETTSVDSSRLEELFKLIELFESLPVERIQRLAPTQNRNFDQMLRHLIEIALSHYPEEPYKATPVRSTDVDINLRAINRLRSA